MNALLLALRGQASNIKPENQGTYTSAEFLALYPQFATTGANPAIPTAVMDMMLDLTNEVVSQTRFGPRWKLACGYYLAHMLTLWLMGNVPAGADPADIVSAGSSIGAVTSESADGVSYSVDTSAVQDLTGWADFKLTRYGVLYASMARLAAKGGMYVW